MGTYKRPIEGWVGNVSSGHLALCAGFMKGIFRSMIGNPESTLDIIPCDYVVNSSLVMGWYVGTHVTHEPEVIHCTSGQINPVTISECCEHMNQTVGIHPSDKIMWLPRSKVRSGWRHNIVFYLFHILPALLFYIPEKLGHKIFGVLNNRR